MGHASIATTNLYLHHLGPRDRAGQDRLNAPGYTGVHEPRSGTNDNDETPPAQPVQAGRTGFPSGGAEGIRTPGLLIANETRYQLRHSPAMREKR